MTSNRATASFTLLVCKGPIRCRAISGKRALQIGPFGLRFLNAILAEQAMACHHRQDRTAVMVLGDRDELGLGRRPHRLGARRGR